MYEVTCLDSNGDIVTSLTQWDTNQSLIIEDSDFDIAPIFHFCNKNSERALGVKSVLKDGVITVDVPNTLLREPYTITAYVYLYKGTNNEKEKSGKTVDVIRIPVRPKPQPTDFEYVDNLNVVYIEDLIAEVHQFHEEVKNAEAIRVSNENQRIENETNRQVSTAAAIQACKDQTQECEKATSETLKAKETVDGLLYDIDGGNAYTNPDYMFQIDGGNCENNNG